MDRNPLRQVDGACDLQGSLAAIPIEVVIQILGFSQLSGVLALHNSHQRATLVINKGNLVWGSLHQQQRRLGQRLLSSSIITVEQLQECLALQKRVTPREKLGEILVTKGLLGLELLHESLETQIKEAFFDILDWQVGTFSFNVKNGFSTDRFMLEKQIEHLLLEKAVMVDTRLSRN
ncbi:MAG: DUF4388 domain-containing protein [Desulfofustis sp.]|nr:DUF4388 domain-containing protein [Desulfofustis sp.]